MKFRVYNSFGCPIADFETKEELVEYIRTTAEVGDRIDIIGDDE